MTDGHIPDLLPSSPQRHDVVARAAQDRLDVVRPSVERYALL